ncbi:putative multidrug resistance protein fnx1 [Annulohypoxylon nitens]|nr:putative multidrug resistance protein fnx1 [Annulohypoxylon nitens]
MGLESSTSSSLDGKSFNKIHEQKPDPSTEQKETYASSMHAENMYDRNDIVYTEGARFWCIFAAVAIMMFIVNFELSVVNTTLVAIVDDIGGFDSVSWVVSAYLLGYVGAIVILSKFSDIFGRKLILLLSIMVFIIFSAACAAAQTMVQLCVFRGFQGLGGGGCWALSTIYVIEMVPPERYAKFLLHVSTANALALLCGPIVGGAIATNTTWRWIFIMNVPICVPAFIVAFLAIPHGFPYGDKPSYLRKAGMKKSLARIDMLGTALILFATLALTSGFEEADKKFPWKSGYIALCLWERHVTLSNGVREPVLPWRCFKNRQMVGILLNTIFLGGPTVVSIFTLPQRYQLVYGFSGLDAGVRLIPFTALIPIGSGFGSRISGRFKIPCVYLMLIGSIMQIIGFAFLGTLPKTLTMPTRTYGLEVLAGFGCGINFLMLLLMIPLVTAEMDNAVGMGAGSQFRMIGSSMILAISTSVFNTYARPELQKVLGMSDTDALSELLPTLAPALQEQVRLILAEGYNRQILVLCVSAAAQIPCTLLMWKRKQITL